MRETSSPKAASSATRLIARLDIKGSHLIKGVQLEGLRKLGDPNEFATSYYEEGVDELIFMDSVASLYGRNNLSEIIKQATANIFIPITVGGGIRSFEDARTALLCGADKVAINTAAVRRPELIREVSEEFGSQCVVLSIEAKRRPGAMDSWEAYTDNGREHTGLDVIEWVQKAVDLGAGEVLLTSVDQEGTQKGFDIPLVKTVVSKTSVPVIASGGMGGLDHFVSVVHEAGADAVAMAHVLHYGKLKLPEIRSYAAANGIGVRTVP